MTNYQTEQSGVLSRVQRQNQTDGAMIAEALNQAQENPQPFMSVDNQGKPVVVGDVTRVQEPSDYVVVFEYPKDMALKAEGAVDIGDGWVRVERLFRDVQITSLMGGYLKSAGAVVWEQMTKLNKNRQLEVLTVGDAFAVFKDIPAELIDAMVRIVQIALGISDVDMKYIQFESLINTTSQLVVNNAGFFQRDIERNATDHQ